MAAALRERIHGVPPDLAALLEAIAKPREEEKPESPCHLVLHNDDFNSFGFVANVLANVLGYSMMKSMYLAIRVHLAGSKPVWTGGRKEAEQRARAIRGAWPDPQGSPRLSPRPLTVTVEAA